jgi:SulP family sulfate permease
MIAFNQAASALGLLNVEKHEKFIDNFNALIHAFPDASMVNFLVFITVLIGLFAVLKYVPKIPAAIVFSVLGIILGMLAKNNIIPLDIFTLSDKFSDLSFSLILPMQPLLRPEVLSLALTITIVAILETMISAKIADGMTGTKHNPRKEMLGLALANIASGLSGGIPATAALARTSLNIKSGATNRISAIANGFAILAISYFLFSFFKFLPLPVIAAILVFTAVRMIEVPHLKKLYTFSRNEFYLTIFVALVCVVEDAIVGLLVGAVIGLLLFVYRQSHGAHQVTVNGKPGKKHKIKTYGSVADAIADKLEKDGVVVYSISGSLVYINGQEHLAAINKLAEHYKTIIIRMRSVHLIDIDGIEIFDEIVSTMESKGINLYVSRVMPSILPRLEASKEFRMLKDIKHVGERTVDVLRSLGYKIEE